MLCLLNEGIRMVKKVLVAGSTGYLGRYVAQEFKKRGYWVRALARNPKKLDQGGPFLEPAIKEQINEVFIGQVTKRETLLGICDDIDIVFNATGSWTSECDFYLYNTVGTLVGSGDVTSNISNVIANCPCGPTSVSPDPSTIMNCGGGVDTVNFTVAGSCAGNFEYQILDGATVVQPWNTTPVYYASPATTTTFTVEVRCTTCPSTVVSDTFLIEVITAPTIVTHDPMYQLFGTKWMVTLIGGFFPAFLITLLKPLLRWHQLRGMEEENQRL